MMAVDRSDHESPASARGTRLIALGILCGIAWSAGFRAYMVELAGPSSHVDWWGTFGAVILPGGITGGLLGWAEAIRRNGGRRGWRWLALAPLSFAVLPMLAPGALIDFLTQGLGGGAVAVALLAIGGGYAVSGRGPLWARILCGVVAAGLLAALVVASPFIAGSVLALTEARGAWVAVLVASFIAILVVACSIPHRRVL